MADINEVPLELAIFNNKVKQQH